VVLATTQSTIGGVILALVVVLVLTYAFVNIRSSRKEVGSEIELAANRKPYVSDEVLEGRKLDRTLMIGMLGLFVVAIGLPVYWLAEPGRQSGAEDEFGRQFDSRGASLFAASGDTADGLNCAGCHGGMRATGGAAEHTITDAEGRFVKLVQWQAPALDTVLLRYSREEVRYILTYGRPFSPMPAWGIDGGGPLNDQQIQNLIDYLASIQITPEEAQEQATNGLDQEKQAAEDAGDPYETDGEALFNLGYYSGFAGGAYSCGRCHTQGWSYGEKEEDGGGAFGPNLTNGSELAQFPGAALGSQQHVEFIMSGSEEGQLYGVNGQGTGRMPGFGSTPAEENNPLETGEVGVEERAEGEEGMLTREQIEAIVQYERGL
jgi:mono/diheme cytochrome c family protein